MHGEQPGQDRTRRVVPRDSIPGCDGSTLPAYHFYNDSNRTEIAELLAATRIAGRHHDLLATQGQLALSKATAILCRDIAESLHAAEQRRPPKAPLLQISIPEDALTYRLHRRTVVIDRTVTTTFWDFARVEDYAQLLPAHALRVLDRVLDLGITPEHIWVTTVVQQRDQRQAPKDPILFLQFGSWCIPIAEWD